MPRNILILFAHPSLHRSEANAPLLATARQVDGVSVIDLYAEYPNFAIDIDKEQQRLRQHEIVIFMHPLYWYSTPAMLKEWQDLVLEYGFAYGAGGTALKDKIFLSVTTAGANADAYCAEGFNHFSLRELMRPLEQTARICGMHYLPPFVLYGARTAGDENRIQPHLERWQRLLIALRDNTLDLNQAQSAASLNDVLSLSAEDM